MPTKYISKIHIYLLLALCLLQSCQYFTPKQSKKDLLDKELKSINWKQVDEFPSIAECETLETKDQQKQCFFEFLTNVIQQKLNTDTITKSTKTDTIYLKITLDKNAKLYFETDSITNKIDSLITTKLVDFPKINPAFKRGIAVQTQFNLPILYRHN